MRWPWVVIDLPTRNAKAVASSNTIDLRPKPENEPWDTEKHSYINCDDQASIDDAIYDNSRSRVLLPRFIEVHFMSPEGKRLYQLDSETQEYSSVQASDGRATKQIEKVCSADRDLVRKRMLDQFETARKHDKDEKVDLKKSDKN